MRMRLAPVLRRDLQHARTTPTCSRHTCSLRYGPLPRTQAARETCLHMHAEAGARQRQRQRACRAGDGRRRHLRMMSFCFCASLFHFSNIVHCFATASSFCCTYCV